jgi:hypothetical protein
MADEKEKAFEKDRDTLKNTPKKVEDELAEKDLDKTSGGWWRDTW